MNDNMHKYVRTCQSMSKMLKTMKIKPISVHIFSNIPYNQSFGVQTQKNRKKQYNILRLFYFFLITFILSDICMTLQLK